VPVFPFVAAWTAALRTVHRGAPASLRTAQRAAHRGLFTTRMSSFDGLAQADVCVLGGGFGGLYTALRLSSLDWGATTKPKITLVDRSDRFAFLPMMYELTTGSVTCWEVAPTFEEVLKDTGIEFVQGEVAGLDAGASLVELQTSEGATRTLPYDQCVLALGAEASFGGVPGAQEHSQPYYTLDDALQLRRLILDKVRDAAGSPLRVTVVGGSYVGVELAANLCSWLPRSQLELTLVHRTDALLSSSAEFSRMVATQQLEESGVRVHLETSVEAIEPSGVTLRRAGSEPLAVPSALTVWAAGSRPSSLAAALGLPTDEVGRLLVDTSLSIEGESRLFALGDVSTCVDARGTRPPSTAQAAMQQADYAAWNVRAALQGARPLPFRYAALGEMLSLGDSSAALSALGLINLQGPLASASRRAVYAARMPTTRQATKVGISWAVDALLGATSKALGAKEKK